VSPLRRYGKILFPVSAEPRGERFHQYNLLVLVKKPDGTAAVCEKPLPTLYHVYPSGGLAKQISETEREYAAASAGRRKRSPKGVGRGRPAKQPRHAGRGRAPGEPGEPPPPPQYAMHPAMFAHGRPGVQMAPLLSSAAMSQIEDATLMRYRAQLILQVRAPS